MSFAFGLLAGCSDMTAAEPQGRDLESSAPDTFVFRYEGTMRASCNLGYQPNNAVVYDENGSIVGSWTGDSDCDDSALSNGGSTTFGLDVEVSRAEFYRIEITDYMGTTDDIGVFSFDQLTSSGYLTPAD